MKIKDLSPDILEQLVDLECNNILPILSSVGLNLTREDMQKQLEFFKESDVVLSYDDSEVDGFAMYECKNDEVTVISFNLKKFNNGQILWTLLNEIFESLQETDIKNIKSHAHHPNQKSLNFHRRMGFKETSSTEHYIEFQISKADLLAVIERRVRA